MESLSPVNLTMQKNNRKTLWITSLLAIGCPLAFLFFLPPISTKLTWPLIRATFSPHPQARIGHILHHFQRELTPHRPDKSTPETADMNNELTRLWQFQPPSIVDISEKKPVLVNFTFFEDGSLHQSKLQQCSGNSSTDTAALQTTNHMVQEGKFTGGAGCQWEFIAEFRGRLVTTSVVGDAFHTRLGDFDEYGNGCMDGNEE